jgi:predicted MFS family arabinose efflux permease
MSPVIRKVVGLVLPDPSYYGWWVVGACLLCAALSAPGQSFALALYIEPIAAELGASRVDIAAVYAWATLAAAFMLPLAGRIADRTSSRFFLSSVVGLMGFSLLLFSYVSSLPALALAFFALRLLGQGAIGLGVLTTVLRWFKRHRARAVAVAVLGYAVGEFVMPTVIVRLQHQFGWRGSLVALASVYLVAFAPLVFMVVRTPIHQEGDIPSRPPGSLQVEVTASEAVRMARFWVLAALVSVTPFVLTGLLLNHVALFDSIGWSAMDVARALQGYALASLAATYGVGAVLDRIPAKMGLLISMSLLALALLVPLGFRSASVGVLLYGALLGAAAGAINATNGVLWPEHFGTGSVGAIKGIVSTVRNGATAAGAPLAIMMAERGGFSSVLIAGASLALVAGCAALFLPPPRCAATAEKTGSLE